MPPVKMVLPNGPRLTELRDERGWTNPQVARKIRCSRQLVWRVLNGGAPRQGNPGRVATGVWGAPAPGHPPPGGFAGVFRADPAELTLSGEVRPRAAMSPRGEALQRAG